MCEVSSAHHLKWKKRKEEGKKNKKKTPVGELGLSARIPAALCLLGCFAFQDISTHLEFPVPKETISLIFSLDNDVWFQRKTLFQVLSLKSLFFFFGPSTCTPSLWPRAPSTWRNVHTHTRVLRRPGGLGRSDQFTAGATHTAAGSRKTERRAGVEGALELALQTSKVHAGGACRVRRPGAAGFRRPGRDDTCLVRKRVHLCV